MEIIVGYYYVLHMHNEFILYGGGVLYPIMIRIHMDV